MIYLADGKLVAFGGCPIDLPPPHNYPDLVQFCTGRIPPSRVILAVDVCGFVWLFREGKCSKVSGLCDIYSIVVDRFRFDDELQIFGITRKKLPISAIIAPTGEAIDVEKYDFESVVSIIPGYVLLSDGRVRSLYDNCGILQDEDCPKFINITDAGYVSLLGEDQKVYVLEDARISGVDIGPILRPNKKFSTELVCYINDRIIVTESGCVCNGSILVAEVPDPYGVIQIVVDSATCYVLQSDRTLLVYENRELIQSIPNIDRLEGPAIHIPRSKKARTD